MKGHPLSRWEPERDHAVDENPATLAAGESENDRKHEHHETQITSLTGAFIFSMIAGIISGLPSVQNLCPYGDENISQRWFADWDCLYFSGEGFDYVGDKTVASARSTRTWCQNCVST